jgi:hypothetical protein
MLKINLNDPSFQIVHWLRFTPSGGLCLLTVLNLWTLFPENYSARYLDNLNVTDSMMYVLEAAALLHTYKE